MKYREFFTRIPRPVRAVINVVLVLLFAAAFYISIDCPTFSFTQEFRRAERAHLIGRSEIVEHISDYYDYDKMLIAETEHGVCYFGRFEVIVGGKGGKNKTENRYTLAYYEKTGDITVAVAPNRTSWTWDMYGVDLPVYIFDEYPEATRAEIVFTVSGTRSYNESEKSYTKTFNDRFSAEATRTGEGFFRFTLPGEGGQRGEAMGLLSSISSRDHFGMNGAEEIVIPFTVRLYDSQNNLILEKTIEITA